MLVTVDRIAQTVQRLATGWMVRGSNPGGGEIFRTCPDRPWGPPSLLYNGYRVFPGGKERPGRDADPSPPSSTVVKKEYSYTSTSPMGLRPVQSLCLYKGALHLTFTVRLRCLTPNWLCYCPFARVTTGVGVIQRGQFATPVYFQVTPKKHPIIIQHK